MSAIDIGLEERSSCRQWTSNKGFW